MRNVSIGHLVLDEEHLAEPQWEFALNGHAAALTDGALEDWNYFADISVGCSTAVDMSVLRSVLSVESDTTFAWVLVARSTRSPIITASSPVEVTGVLQEIALEIPASSLGGTLALELMMIVIRVPDAGTAKFAPSRIGHIVYSNMTKIYLEGDSGQLPLLPVSFKDQGIKNPTTALWWLKIMAHDLNTPANAALWLWINTDNDQLKPLLEGADPELGLVWMQFLQTDFTRQLLREALVSEDLDTSQEYARESLGELLISVVKLVGSGVEQVRAAYADDPGRIETELQAIVQKAHR